MRAVQGAVALRILAFAIGMFQCLSPAFSQACPLGKQVPIGYGDVSIILPDGWTIDKGTVYMEVVSYVVKRPNSSEKALGIVATGTSEQEHLEKAGRPYCINGISGLSMVADGIRTIRLEMPPPKDPRVYDAAVIFTFQDSDREAAKIVATTQLKGNVSRCPD